MTITTWRSQFWWHWIAANSLAELVGLGTVAALGYVIASLLAAGLGLVAGPALAFAVGAIHGRALLWLLPAEIVQPTTDDTDAQLHQASAYQTRTGGAS